MNYGYSSDIFQVAQDTKLAGRKFTIAASIPKQVAVLALDSMVLHNSGHSPDPALQFINFILNGKNAAQLTNLIGSGNPNLDMMRYMNPEMAKDPAIFPGKNANLQMLRDLDLRQRRMLSRIRTEIKLR